MRLVFALTVCVSLVGCSNVKYSKNMKTATVQASVTVATKALLDGVTVEKYDNAKKQVIDVAQDVSKFLDTGKIGDLPLGAARTAIIDYMTKKGWTDYIVMVTAIMDIIEAQQVKTEKIGQDNIAIIKFGLEAAVISANSSRVEWRVQPAPAPAPTPVPALAPASVQ